MFKKKKLDLLEGPIFKNLIILAAPLMATAFLQITYNFVDMIWLGQLGTREVAAVGASGIYSWIASSFATIVRVSSSVYTAQYYGANKTKRLYQTIKNALHLIYIFAIIYGSLSYVFAKPLIGFFNLEADVSKMGVTYLKLMSVGYLVQFVNPILSGFYNNLGDSITPFKYNAIGLVINLLLDPVLIFGFGPFPKLGVLGAAIATIFAQLVVNLLFYMNIYKTKTEIYMGIKEGKHNIDSKKDMLKLGFPAGIQSTIMASISLVLNRLLASYGSTPMAVHTIGTNIESISWMSVEGLQHGIIAFVGQNFGAQKNDRLKEIIKKSMTIALAIGLIASAILIGLRNQLFHLFIPHEPEAIMIGSSFLLILGLSQTFMSMEIASAGVFHGFGLTKIPSNISIIFNLMRIPLAYLLVMYFDFYGVWIAITTSSVLKGVISNIILYKKYQEIDLRPKNHNI